MVKYLKFILVLLVMLECYLCGYGQFDPTSTLGGYPTGADVTFEPNKSGLSVTCASCPSGSRTQIFSVTIFNDGTSNPAEVMFDWVVYGGTISNQSGATTVSNTVTFGSPDHEYRRIKGESGASSWIEVTFDTQLPDTAWVAVQQIGEYGCTDDKWTAYLMVADTENPTIAIQDEDTWTNSLVAVIAPPADATIVLGSFYDYVHSPTDAIGATTTLNLAPIPSDNCTINEAPPSALDLAGTIHDGDYGVGSYIFTSTAYDCQGNTFEVTQQLDVYDSTDFSMDAPADFTFANTVCSPADALFLEDLAAITNLTFPAGWSERSRSSVLNSDAAVTLNPCVWSRTRTYIVTLVHDNGYNTFDITADQTYFYTVDGTGPALTTQDITVNLDATGNVTIIADDVILALSDGCTGNPADITRSVNPSAFTGVNLGLNLVTVFATDLCSNTSSETAIVTVVDGIAPEIVSCPGNYSINNTVGDCEATLTPAVPVFTDNSGVAPTVTWTTDMAIPPGSLVNCVFPLGTTTITYTATDGSGNSIDCVFTVTVNDAEVPVLSNIPANVAHLAWELRENFTFTIPTVTDNCGVTAFDMTINPGAVSVPLLAVMGDPYTFGVGNPLSVGLNTITFEYSDGTNTLTRDYTIYVDYQPTLTELNSLNPSCIGLDDGEIEVFPDFESGSNMLLEYSTDNFATSTVMTANILPGIPAGTYQFRASAEVNGYTTETNVLEVTLSDPPSIIINELVTSETCLGDADGAIAITVNYSPVPARTIALTWTRDGIAFTPADVYNLTNLVAGEYIVTVTDEFFCEASETYNLTTDNGNLPTITDAATTILVAGVANLNVDAGTCGIIVDNATYGFDPTADDGTCGPLTPVHDYTGTTIPWLDATTLEGAFFAVGSTTVTWTATDATGNVATTSYTINVTDNINPTINDQVDITHPYCEATRAIPLPVVSDNCDISTVILSFTVGAVTTVDPTNWWPHIAALETETTPMPFDPTVVTTVTWTVTDVNGLTAVDDYNVDFTDPIAMTPTFDITNVSCNGYNDGQIIVDFEGGTSPYVLTVGSVYPAASVTGLIHPVATITNLVPNDYTITITDAVGCVFTQVYFVLEPDPIAIVTNTQTTNTCFESNEADLEQTITGGNGGYSYIWSRLPYSYADGHPYDYTTVYTFDDSEDQTDMPTGFYTLQVSDVNGCTQNANYEITSDDVTAPTFTLSPDFVRNTSDNVPGDCNYLVSGDEFDPQAISDADGCDTRIWHNYAAAVSTTTLGGTNFLPGIYTIVWSIYDLSGNGVDSTITIEIIDDELPSITCPGNITTTADPDECSAQIYAIDNVSVFYANGGTTSDNGCTLPVNGLTYLRSDYFSAGLDDPFDARPLPDHITWTITDAGGNSVSCDQQIRVTDNQVPDMVVLGTLATPVEIVLKGDGTVTVLPDDVDGGTTDNCTTLDALYIYKDGAPPALHHSPSIEYNCSDIVNNPQLVNLVAVDVAGNENEMLTYVNIVDRTAPTVNTKPFNISVTAAGTILYPADIYDGTNNDNCDTNNLTFGLSLISGGAIVPSLTYDCSMIGQRTVYLVATDRSGNTSYTPAVVTAVDNTGPVITLTWDEDDNFALADVAGGHTVLDPNMFGTATDCSAFTLRMNPEFVDCSHKGKNNQSIPVQLIATDLYGTSNTVTFNLRVRDLTPPVIVLNNNSIVLVGSATTNVYGSDFVATIVDNCTAPGDMTYGIRIVASTLNGPDNHQDNVGAGHYLQDYWNRYRISCANEDDEVEIWICALDEDDNASAEYPITTSIRSDLTIESLMLDLCDFTAPRFDSRTFPRASNPRHNPEYPWICDALYNWKFRDKPMYNGLFRSVITRGGLPHIPTSYVWSATNNNNGNDVPTFGYQDNHIPCSWSSECGSNNDLGGYIGSTAQIPEYTYANCFSGVNAYQTILLEVTDNMGCHASNTLTVYEPSGLEVESIFTIETEVCRNANQTYTQPAIAGTTYSWSIISGGGTIVSNTGNTFTVNWGHPTATSGEVRCVAEVVATGCSSDTYYEVTINNVPSVSIDPSSGTDICPLTNIVYTATAIGTGPFQYDWEYTNGTPVLHGDLYSDVTIRWALPSPGPTGIGDVSITVTDAHGCTAQDVTNVTIGDVTAPEVNLPATYPVNNNPGECQGAVLMILSSPYDAGTEFTYGDNCEGALTVQYRTRFSADPLVDWSTSVIPWGTLNTSLNASGNYPVGQTQIEWRITDVSGNRKTEYVVIVVSDNDAPTFNSSPSSYSHVASAACDYTHALSEGNWDMTATDNCDVPVFPNLYVTFSDDLPTNHYATVIGHTFTNSVTDVTWHVVDDAGNEATHTYQVLLTDDIDPVFAFDLSSVPVDDANFNYEGTYAAGTGSKFYIFGDGTAPSIDITAIITDNCGMGPVSVTVTHTDDTGSTVGPANAIAPGGSNDYTFTFSPDLGQSKIVWNYDDATGNHAQRVTQYVVYANNQGFSCIPPSGWTDASAHCNPANEEFVTDNSEPDFPGWFDYLNSNNVLNYRVTQNAVLGAQPAPVGCVVSDRERTLEVTYNMQIQGSSVDQLTATGSCLQEFDYTVDNTGPVIQVVPDDLVLECNSSVDFSGDITTWLNNYAGVDPSAGTIEITDDCSGAAGFTITNNYASLVLAGTTCGSGSITTVTFTVTDDCGQSTDYTADIVFVDTQVPAFPVGMPANTTVECDNIPAVPVLATIVSTDDCDINPVESFSSSNTKNANGTVGDSDDNNYSITRNWAATDACGNSAFYVQTITVEDTDPAYFTSGGIEIDVSAMPTDVTVDCNNIPATPVYGGGDNCDINPTLYTPLTHPLTNRISTRGTDPTQPDYYNYTITRIWSVQDNTWPAVVHTQVITVVDNVAPVIVTPASNLTVECRGLALLTDYPEYNSWLANNGGAVATNQCTSPLNFTWSYVVNAPSDDCGITEAVEVIFTVSDPVGNSSQTTATFTIIDTRAPVLSGTLIPLGPYNALGDLPAAYTTVAQLEAAGVTVTDACSADGALTVNLVSQTVGVGDCSFPVTRVYSVTDPCSHTSATTLSQVLTVRDAIKPTILKALSEPVYCSDPLSNPADRSITIASGFALLATDISDNCKTGQWFIDNAATGAIRYRLNHLTKPHDIPWTNGNPDGFTFYEGVTEVFYEVRDEVNNYISNVYNVTVNTQPVIAVEVAPLVASTPGIIGGAYNPSQSSTHSYTVTMDKISNLVPTPIMNTGWDIYPTGDRTTPYAGGVDYTITVTNVASVVTAQITFNGTLPIGGTYDLVFTEQDVNGCEDESFISFTLEDAFDVDVTAPGDGCPIESGNIHTHNASLQTTSVYTITLQNSNYTFDWRFNYYISGNTATINSITPAGTATHSNVGGNGNATVTGGTTSVTLTVVYEYSTGAAQNIVIQLDGISGAFGEIDVDGINRANNQATHIINVLPNPEDVSGVN